MAPPVVRKSWGRRLGVAFMVLAGLVATVVGALYLYLRNPLPQGVEGPTADSLAREMQRAVDHPAWERTGAVRWTARSGAEHLWDRARGYDRFRRRDVTVLLNLGTQRGVATRAGTRLVGEELDRALQRAWRAWCNDSYWLNPIAKVFDPGTYRERVELPGGERGLLVGYRSGGVTPGDRYLYIVGADGRARAWRMWVSVLLVPGIEATWEDWVRLPTGAWLSTRHRVAGSVIAPSELRAGATLAEVSPGADPFAEFVPPPPPPPPPPPLSSMLTGRTVALALAVPHPSLLGPE